MKKLVILSGAGISVESGLQTFRGHDGLWEGYDIYEVASIEGWNKNPSLVQEFYNKRRAACLAAKPNAAHRGLVYLEQFYELQIITQNVDTLHEIAGSKKVLHLHGRIDEARSSIDRNLIYPIIGNEIKMGERCAHGTQLRPNIVWFGEEVPQIEAAAKFIAEADLLVVIGTSLAVYPAAGLLDYRPRTCELIVIDPNSSELMIPAEATLISHGASEGVGILIEKLTK